MLVKMFHETGSILIHYAGLCGRKQCTTDMGMRMVLENILQCKMKSQGFTPRDIRIKQLSLYRVVHMLGASL
jgi:hypothetical protein